MTDLICHECHGTLSRPDEYHPLVFCELVKLGHPRPADYLRQALIGADVELPSTVAEATR